MKGSNEAVVLMLSVFTLIFLIVGVSGVLNKSFGDGGLYDKFSKPLLWSSEEAMKIGMNKYLEKNQAYLDKVNSVFSGDPIEARCSQWYLDCGGTVTGIWNHNPGITEFDFDRVAVLCNDKSSDARERIREQWLASDDSSFKELSSEQQFSMMKNACAVNLLNQIKQAQDARGE